MPKPCSILVVEDQPDVRYFLETALAHEGYHTGSARDAGKARRALAHGDFDLVMTDIRLPGEEDGLSLARHVREQGRGVILITGSYALRETLEAGPFRYLLKPFRLAAVTRTVQEALAEQGRCVPRYRRVDALG